MSYKISFREANMKELLQLTYTSTNINF